ncbi:MAG TPA: VanW family protein [Thermomicrobiales bacterium]|nr:VanW family protein [Thermomicrobiales bacterium]
MQAKTTRDLWSAGRARPGAWLTRRTARRRSARADSGAPGQPDTQSATPETGSRLTRSTRRAYAIAHHRVVLYVSVALVLALGLSFTGRLTVRGEVYPGVQAFGVSLGGLTETEARAQLATRARELAQTKVAVTYEGHIWSPTLAELGVTFDVDAAVRDAMGYGRRDHVVTGLFRPLGVAAGPVDLPSAIRFDQVTFDRSLLELAREIDLAPVDTAIEIQGGKPTLSQEHDGQVFETRAAQQDLLGQLRASSTPALTLTAVPKAASLRAADFATVESSLEQALSAPLIFSDGDRRWSVSVEDLAGMVRLAPPHDGQPASAILNPASVRSLGEKLAGEIDQQAREASIDESGEVARLVAATPARTVHIDDFVAAVQAVFAAGQHDVAVPVDESATATTTEDFVSGLGITDLLATGTSDFSGSEPGRATNVVVAARLVDGVMVPPHGTFSFNHSIGEINVTPGFVPAGASENGIPGTAVGGGVCQVTTTVFRAVLKAGLPVVEWWPHAYRNVYYEQGGWAPGFDASVQQPDDDPFNGSDFRFDNPTDNWLLVRSEIVDGTKLTVEIYGAPTGYKVEVDDPIDEEYVWAEGLPAQESVDPSLPAGTVDLVQPARDGMTMTVYRRVFDAAGNQVLADNFVSIYEPQGPSYRVSPDMAGSTAGEQ